MENQNLICMWIAELVPLSATLFSFIYGIRNFFKKGKPLFLQSITKKAVNIYTKNCVKMVFLSVTLIKKESKIITVSQSVRVRKWKNLYL